MKRRQDTQMQHRTIVNEKSWPARLRARAKRTTGEVEARKLSRLARLIEIMEEQAITLCQWSKGLVPLTECTLGPEKERIRLPRLTEPSATASLRTLAAVGFEQVQQGLRALYRKAERLLTEDTGDASPTT